MSTKTKPLFSALLSCLARTRLARTRLALTSLTLCGLIAINSASAELPAADFETAMKKYLDSATGQKALGSTVETYFQKKQAEMASAQENKEKDELEQQLKNPVTVDITGNPVKGPANAKITIVEFTDFQCPYCKRGADVIAQVVKAYPNDVKVAFKNLPLPFHKEAMPAAKAALAANKQGKFWEFYTELFNNQGQLSTAFYEATAKKVGLNVEKWKTDMAAPETETQIKADMAIAEKNGIQGTPGFFVGGVAVKGAYPFEHFKMIIDKLLAK